MSVDHSKKKGDFWITGSQVFRLMKNVSESLAGRVGIVNLLGYPMRKSIMNQASLSRQKPGI